MNATNPTTQAQRRYVIEFTLAVAAYLVVLFATRLAFRNLTGPWEPVVALLPVVPVIAVFVAVLRWLRATDELNRRIIVDSLAIAGGITALLAATYGFAESDFLPRPSAWWTWCVFMFTWAICATILRRRYQ